MTICECHNQIEEKASKLSAYAALNRTDPTRTLFLRKQFERDMVSRFRQLRGVIRRAIVDEDVFALRDAIKIIIIQAELTTPGARAFDFPRSADKVSGFMKWLEEQNQIFFETEGGSGIQSIRVPQLGAGAEGIWTDRYIQSAYQRGILRGRTELKKAGYDVPTIAKSGGIDVAFNQPFHVDRVGLLYTRAFNDLKGITNNMDAQISRVLSQGIAEGRNPRDLARLLNRTITGPSGDLALTDTLGRFIPAQRRAMMLARTEIIRAHHLATIQEYRNFGVVGVTVIVEFRTAGDKRVCAICQGLEGQQFTLDQAEGQIPVHPLCRCTMIPVPASRAQRKPLSFEERQRFLGSV